MTEHPQWLAGLTPLSEGVWRDDETGLYVHLDLSLGLWLQVGDSQIADDNRVHVAQYANIGMTEPEIVSERAYLTVEDAPRHAAALTLAARLARAYNESGGA